MTSAISKRMLGGLAAALILSSSAACGRSSGAPAPTPDAAPVPTDLALLPGPMPVAPSADLLGLLGEYEAGRVERIVLENEGRLWLSDSAGTVIAPLTTRGDDRFGIAPRDAQTLTGVGVDQLAFARANGRGTAILAGDTRLPRRVVEPLPGTNQLQVKPLRPVEELRREALAATPPGEPKPARAAELVELTRLDPTIRLEIRYATTNNFLGTRFYDEPRAFMQRPAAEAVVRANRALRALGYGLLIHDAYRPWYVTKMFWDATPDDKKWLVANPAQGSKHNRGCAVDLTLYDLATGKPVEMPSTYDESTDRAFANYPGGTAQQRWRRRLLRDAMVRQGFEINPNEWWHFDYRDWRSYGIGNVAFDRIAH